MIDGVSQEAILDFLQFRRVCDNTRFGAYFNTRIRMHAPQYVSALRIETIEYDPMVSDYMERQHLDERTTDRSGSSTRTDSGKTDTTDNVTTTTKSTADGTKSGNGSRNESRVENGSTTSTGNTSSDVTDSGSDTVKTDTIKDTTGSTTHGLKNITADSGSDQSKSIETASDNRTEAVRENSTDSGSHTTGNRLIQDATPDSSTYGLGMPEQLNHAYTTAQEERAETGSSSGTKALDRTTTRGGGTSGNKTDTTTYGKTVTSTNSGTDQVTGIDTVDDTQRTTYGKTTATTGTSRDEGTTKSEVTGRVTDETSETSHDSSNQEGKTIGTRGTTTSGTTSSEESGNVTEKADSRERYSGRHESPQDLMARAYAFTMKTNAFKWLIERMGECFYGLMDEEEREYGYW